MSWQKYTVKLVLGLPLSFPIVTYAVNIGDTYVQSQQNQPLNARINVSDIDPRTFSVKMAQSDIYQQLGLSKESEVQARFEPTSSNGGQIILSTSQPINAPFTDVVLTITNQGETKTLPKTLLMPINSKQKITTQANTSTLRDTNRQVVLGAANPVNLPLVLSPYTGNDVNVLPTSQPTKQMAESTQTSTPTPTTPTVTTHNNGVLRIQEVRTYRAVSNNFDTPNQPQAINPNTSDSTYPTATPTQKPIKKQKNRTTSSPSSAPPTATTTYVLQRNDNLWTIARKIAAANRKDTASVMADIMAANPNAFADNDPTKLTANTELKLPKYKTVPSQLGINNANEARQQTKSTKLPKSTKQKKPQQPTAAPAVSTHTPKRSKPSTQSGRTPAKVAPAVKTNKKSEMTIIAPTTQNGTAQGQSSPNKQKTSKGLSPQALAQLQQKRQQTASQANKVGQLNQSLVSADTRLKLQNAKLAQLEQRLKELNKK
jgi:Tfp pilus assembly protein FimV